MVAYLLFAVLQAQGVFLSQPLHAFVQVHPSWSRCLFWLVVNGVGFVVCLRSALIGLIRLYQRYAPEDVRRRCLFMPTCSEYAIIALQKHGVVIGLVMILDRLWYRCRGSIYRIDFP